MILEQLIESTYELYSKDIDISFEDYLNKVVNDEEFEYIFKDLCEKNKIVIDDYNRGLDM